MSKSKIAVAGNATLDVYVQGDISIDGAEVRISSDGQSITLRVDDLPIIQGSKNRINQDIADTVRPLWHRYVPGGGGFNSAMAMHALGPEHDLTYLDVSIADRQVINALREAGIQSYHFYKRRVPVNMVLQCGPDKIVLKGPQLGRVGPDEMELALIDQVIGSCDAFLANSVKDPEFVRAYIEAGIEHRLPMFFSVTTSLETDFVYSQVLPNGTTIMNYDDLAVVSRKPELLQDSMLRMDHAFETIRNIRQQEINNRDNIYVTLGGNGAYCSDGTGIYHVQLTEMEAGKVGSFLNTGRGHVNGAGDVFAGAVVMNEFSRKMSCLETAVEASKAAIRHIGYPGILTAESFKVSKIE